MVGALVGLVVFIAGSAGGLKQTLMLGARQCTACFGPFQVSGNFDLMKVVDRGDSILHHDHLLTFRKVVGGRCLLLLTDADLIQPVEHKSFCTASPFAITKVHTGDTFQDVTGINVGLGGLEVVQTTCVPQSS